MAGNIKGITIEIGGDTKKLTSALKGVDKEIRGTQTALKQVEKLLKLDPKNTELLTQKEKLLKEAIEETKDRLQMLKDVAESGDLGADEHDALQREIIETEQKLKELESQYNSFGSVGRQQMVALGTSIQEIGEKVKEVGDKIKGAGEDLTKKVTAPIMALGGASVKAFKEVDTGYDVLIAKTGATGKELDDLKGIFDNLYTSMNVPSEEVGSALGEVVTRLHLTGKEAEDVSRKFLQYAQLNNVEVSSSVDNVQQALSAFNLPASEASRLLDVLNRTSQNTGAEVGKMETSLTQNATALQEMGMNIYQSVGFLGQLETAGADSESVISGLKRALKSATEEGTPFNEALANLENTIVNGTDSMDGLSASYELFGKSGAGVFQAVKNGQLSFTDLISAEEVLADSTDSVASTFESTQDGVDAFYEAMHSANEALGDLGESIAGTVAPMLQTFVDGINKVRDAFNELSPKQQEIIVKIGLVLAVLGPVLVIIGTVISSIGSIIAVVGGLISALALLNPVFIAIGLAIAAVIAVGVALYTHWDTIKAKATEIVQSVLNAWNAFKANTIMIFNGIKNVVTTAMQSLASFLMGIGSSIVSALTRPFQNAWNTISGIVSRLKGIFNFHWSLPPIKVPHFSISGGFSIVPPKVPSISVSWYKKAMDNAMLLTNPTIFGMSGGHLLGGGEAGNEVISGESHLIGLIGDAVGAQMSPIYNLMAQYFPEFAQQTIAIPERSLVRGLRKMGVSFV